MAIPLEKIRNIGIIAHIDAGKTTVTERMLFTSGTKHRAGAVDMGTTTTDDDPEEAERGITIYSACVQFPWKDIIVNLIDTPGHVDFTAEVERSLRVLDGGVVVFSAREGVEAQSETVWRQADKYKVPRLAFINKLDREGADFESVFQEIGNRLGANPVALQIPVGQGPAHTPHPFRGVIDVVRLKLLSFPEGKEGSKVVASDIDDEDVLAEAKLWRERMLESLYNYSNELMELALAEQVIPETLIHKVLREATLHLQIQPVLCGSALHGIGVEPVLDAVAAYLPNPKDVPPVEGTDLKPRGKGKAAEAAGEKVKKILRKPDPAEPFCGLVFKIQPYKTGDLSWIRIYSGTLDPNSRVLNSTRDKKENVAQLWRIHASKKDEQLTSARAGDIVGVIGLRDSITGDTLCDTREPILLASIEFPDTVISMSIEPESTEDRKKLGETLTMLRKQDPTFRAEENPETGQTLISGMGELHLEVIQHRLLRDYRLNVKVHKPRVSYRETVARSAEVTGESSRVIQGVHHAAKVRIRLEPHEKSIGPLTVTNALDHGGLPGEMLTVILEELENAGHGGGVLGFPLMRLKAAVLGGEVGETGPSEIAFRTATNHAFDQALRAAGPVLLEPIMKLEISTPDEHVGDLVSDLQQRRAIIHSTESRGTATVLHAEAPLANLFGYSSAMRSLSQGRASCSMEPSTYAPAPDEVLQKFLGES